MKRPDRHETPIRRVRPHDFYSPPKPAICRRCRTPIWTALYDDKTIQLTPQPITQLGELSTLIAGANTYLLLADRLTRRTARAITDRPTPVLGTIHASHICGHPPPPEHLQPSEETDELGGLFETPCPF